MDKVDKKRKETDWDALDAWALPRVRHIIKESEKGKPVQITFSYIANQLGDITAWQLYHMPECCKLVQASCEPIEMYWERKLRWVEQLLIAEGVEPSEDKMFTKAGVERKKFEQRVGVLRPPGKGDG